MLGPLFKPPGQALNAFASVLCEHWRTARERAAQLLWVTSVNWLEPQRLRAVRVRAPITTSRAGGDSSGTPPDPRR